MPVPTSIASLSTVASSNSPQGTETVGPYMNEYIQEAYAFIAQLYAGGMVPTGPLNLNGQKITNLANGVATTDAAAWGQVQTLAGNYLPLTGGVMTGSFTANSTVTVNSTGQNAVTIQANIANVGANIRLLDEGSNTSKYVRCLSNVFGIMDTAYATELLALDNSGNLTVTGSMSAPTITMTSDRRLKSHIKRIRNATDVVLSWVGVTFQRKGDKSKRRHVGFIANDFTSELVYEDENGIKSIAYGNTSAYLAEAFKELEARVRKLEGGK